MNYNVKLRLPRTESTGPKVYRWWKTFQNSGGFQLVFASQNNLENNLRYKTCAEDRKKDNRVSQFTRPLIENKYQNIITNKIRRKGKMLLPIPFRYL